MKKIGNYINNKMMTTAEDINIQTTDISTFKNTTGVNDKIIKESINNISTTNKKDNQKDNTGSKKNFTLKTPKVINDKPFIGYIYITNYIKY